MPYMFRRNQIAIKLVTVHRSVENNLKLKKVQMLNINLESKQIAFRFICFLVRKLFNLAGAVFFDSALPAPLPLFFIGFSCTSPLIRVVFQHLPALRSMGVNLREISCFVSLDVFLWEERVMILKDYFNVFFRYFVLFLFLVGEEVLRPHWRLAFRCNVHCCNESQNIYF